MQEASFLMMRLILCFSNHLSFCFNFFLHGESTVCASIEVKQHPSVTMLDANHLVHAQENQTHLPGNVDVLRRITPKYFSFSQEW